MAKGGRRGRLEAAGVRNGTAAQAAGRIIGRQVGASRRSQASLGRLWAEGRVGTSRRTAAALRGRGFSGVRATPGGMTRASRNAPRSRARRGGTYAGLPVANQRRGGFLPPNRRPRRPRRR